MVMKDGKKEVGVVLNWSESDIIAYFKWQFFAFHYNTDSSGKQLVSIWC